MTKHLDTRRWWKFVPVLADREPFTTGGELCGKSVLTTTGELPDNHQVTLRTLDADGHLSYVVYSYDTPIAWRDTGGTWTVPDVRYSTTTTRHQSLIRAAVSIIDKADDYRDIS